MNIAKLNVSSIKAAPVVTQFTPVPVNTPPNIPDIPLSTIVVSIIAPRRSIVHPDIVAVALSVDDLEITQSIPS